MFVIVSLQTGISTAVNCNRIAFLIIGVAPPYTNCYHEQNYGYSCNMPSYIIYYNKNNNIMILNA